MFRTVSKKIMGVLVILLTSIFCSTVVNAQNQQISGVVIDESGLPVIGAGVVVVGQRTVGTTTDLDGKYALSVPAGASVEFSCIGYDNQVVAVGNQSVINVTLASNNVIEETVVYRRRVTLPGPSLQSAVTISTTVPQVMPLPPFRERLPV